MRPARAGGSACRCRATTRAETTRSAVALLRRDFRALEMLVGRAVVALGQRGALTRLAFARGRAAAGDAAVECARLDLALDESDRRCDAFAHRPGDLRL